MRTEKRGTTVNKCTKRCAARAKLVLLFFFVLVADAVEHYAVIFFV